MVVNRVVFETYMSRAFKTKYAAKGRLADDTVEVMDGLSCGVHVVFEEKSIPRLIYYCPVA